MCLGKGPAQKTLMPACNWLGSLGWMQQRGEPRSVVSCVSVNAEHEEEGIAARPQQQHCTYRSVQAAPTRAPRAPEGHHCAPGVTRVDDAQ